MAGTYAARADNRAFAESISRHERWPRQRMPGVDQMNALMPLALRSYVGRHLGALEFGA
jgi:hypothetical protein